MERRGEDKCLAGNLDGTRCHEYRGLRFCLYHGTYRCWRHLCEHLKEKK